jgi:hypothetical protein
VALNDLAGALGDIAAEYRIIGGHMVTVMAARWQLGASLYRETGDVDFGIPPIVVRDHHVVDRLKDISYVQIAGNRFARGLSDIPAGMKGETYPQDPEALIDVLVPAYTSRARENIRVDDDLFTTEVPGLDLAGRGDLRLGGRPPSNTCWPGWRPVHNRLLGRRNGEEADRSVAALRDDHPALLPLFSGR